MHTYEKTSIMKKSRIILTNYFKRSYVKNTKMRAVGTTFTNAQSYRDIMPRIFKP